MSPFEATKKRSNNLEKLPLIQSSPRQWKQRGLFQLLYYFSQKSETGGMMKVRFDCHASVLQTLIKTVLNLINNSQINCAGANSSNFTMTLSLYRSISHSFQNPKKRVFPFFLSATRNPGFKILPRIWNTKGDTPTQELSNHSEWECNCSAGNCASCAEVSYRDVVAYLPWKLNVLRTLKGLFRRNAARETVAREFVCFIITGGPWLRFASDAPLLFEERRVRSSRGLPAHVRSGQGRIYLKRCPRLIHLWGPLSHCCEEKWKRLLINLRKAANDDIDVINVLSKKLQIITRVPHDHWTCCCLRLKRRRWH